MCDELPAFWGEGSVVSILPFFDLLQFRSTFEGDHLVSVTCYRVVQERGLGVHLDGCVLGALVRVKVGLYWLIHLYCVHVGLVRQVPVLRFHFGCGQFKVHHSSLHYLYYFRRRQVRFAPKCVVSSTRFYVGGRSMNSYQYAVVRYVEERSRKIKGDSRLVL